MGSHCNSYWRSLGIAALAVMAVLPVRASDEALIEILRANKLITEKQYESLKAQGAAQQPAPAAQPAPGGEDDLLSVLLKNGLISQTQYADLKVKTAQQKRADQEVKLSLKDGFKLKSRDGSFQVQPGVYFQFDSAWYDDDGTDFSDGTELRRGRLSLAGTLLWDWDYKFEADFAGTTQGGTTNTVTVTDAYVRYNGFRPLSITTGNFKVPFSLEAVGSAKYMTFMERGLPFAFLNLRQLGGMVSAAGDNWTAAAGVFGDTVTTQNNDDEGVGAAGRFTFAPLFQSDRVLHLGLAGAWREPDANPAAGLGKTLRFRSKPESNILSDALAESAVITRGGTTFGRSSGRLVDTGNIPGDVRYYTLLGAELAAIYGPWSLQGEYIRADVDRRSGGDLVFDGYYVYASWFPSGESRNYRPDKGVFDVLQPLRPFSLKGGLGAWEVAARFSSLDLSDRTVLGGEIEDLTLGLNWYPNAYLRFMMNYLKVLSVRGGAHSGDNPDLVQLRVQVVY